MSKNRLIKLKINSKILVIAGSDSSGGAGIQADIKTITTLGSYAMTAITAITSQNTTGVMSIFPVSSKEISNQIEFTAKDIKPDAVKIGMLHSKEVIKSVMKSLKKINAKKIILDPVMVAKGGRKLIDNQAIKILKNKYLSKADLITPNIPEAEVLTNSRIITVKDIISAGKLLLKLGAKNVLIKGGHLKSKNIQDVFINQREIVIFKNKKIYTKNSHGTGCTLSSAITTYFACGKTLKRSCEMAIKYVNHSLRTQPNLGKGHGPVNHLNSIQIKKIFRWKM